LVICRVNDAESPSKVRLGIFLSGQGTNAEAIVNYFDGHAVISAAALYSNSEHSGTLALSTKYDLPCLIFDRATFVKQPDVLLDHLRQHNISHIILAGFLWLVPAYLIEAYPGKIINIHPALLPKYGGKGMYGMHVHNAVHGAGEKFSGITIHLVNEIYDQGRILFQKEIDIAGDEPEKIFEKVQKLEHYFYPRVIEQFVLKADGCKDAA
jgi:phosphoribosylglycinamide formyltransferase 1